MTRTKSADITLSDTVRLGNFERAVGAIAMAMLIAIGAIVWADHETLGRQATQIAVIQEHLKASTGDK